MSNTANFNERLYTDCYDSVNQRKRAGFNSNNDLEIAKCFYLGRLRLDSLLSKTLVLTDNQILDGCLFLQQDPSEFLKKLVRKKEDSLPLEIRARGGKFEDTILGFVKKQGQPKLRGFSFSCIEDENARTQVQNFLQEINSSEVNSWKQVCQILKEISIAQDFVDQIEHGWAKWIEAQDTILKGKVLKWDRANFTLEDCIFISADKHLQRLKTAQGKELAEWANRTRDRSSLDGKISELRKTADSDLGSDLSLVEVWFHYAYNLAIARQHRCRTFESVRGSYEERLSGLSLIDEFTTEVAKFEAPPEIVYGLGMMPTDQYQNIFSLYSNSFEMWWENNDSDALRRGIEPYLEAGLNQQSTDMLKTAIKMGIIGAVGGLVAGPITGAVVGVCSYLLIDQLGEKALSKKTRMLNRIIHYASLSTR
jgi:hypothetical protein